MKRIFILYLLFINQAMSFDLELNNKETHFSVTEKTITEFTFVNSLSEISSSLVKQLDNDFIRLNIDSYGSDSKNGEAELPVLQKLIRIPLNADLSIQILNIEEKIVDVADFGYDNLKVFPNQPSILKSQSLDDVPFYFDQDYYQIDDFIDHDLVKVEMLGNMRGQKIARLSISPVYYHPKSNKLRIVTRVEAKIVFKNFNIDEDIQMRKRYYSPEFESLYKSFVNYTSPFHKDVITTYPVKYVIISDPLFQNVLQPFIEWKRKKGFLVVEEYTNNPLVGNTTSSIHTYIKDLYDNASASDPAPTYLLIVGDLNEVPSFNTGQHVSDMYYCEFDGGGDFYPEMYYGRFSGSTTEQIENQVNKTLKYEQYLLSDFSYLDEVVLVAGVDASMAPVYGNGQINYGTSNYFNPAHNLTVHNYLYGSGTPITSDMPAASSAIISDISNGVGFANYTAHCGSSGWSDPAFEVSDVASLQNFDEYGLLVGNCCQSAKFDVPVCFGESLLRAEDKGAIGYIGGSNNTYWDEDYWWAVGNTSNIVANPTYSATGLAFYDCWIHENGEAQSDWFFTQGQMIHSGNLAVTQAGGSEQYYWEIYHLMGDPSVMPYLGVPAVLSVSHQGATPIGTSSFTVTTEENAYVALSMNGILLDAQLAGSSGIVNLTFPSLVNIGSADLVITKQFRQPYIGSVSVISSNAPFVVYNTHVVNDPAGNNNNLVDYGELIELDVEIQNIGSQSAQNLTVEISSSDPYVSLIDSVDYLATINANQTININSPFTFQVDNYVPDQHDVMFNITITDNQLNTWTSNLSLTLNAPVLSDLGITLDDFSLGNGNGKLDAGETLDIIIHIENTGHADIINLNSFVSCLSNYLTVNNAVNSTTLLAPSQQESLVFNVTTNANTPFGTLVQFNFDMTDGVYSYSNIFSETIGIIDEDYETGDFTQYSWDNDPSYPWVISTNNPYEGLNCSRSALNQPDQTDSELSIDVNVLANGEISFFKKMSSEDGYDFLKFRINGQKVGEWSGIDSDWTFVSFPVNAGQNSFMWEYDKDWSASAGDDCAYVDYIVFPPIDLGNSTSILEAKLDVVFYPNPTIGSFSILLNDNKDHKINIYNISGKLISSTIGNSKINFDLSKYPSVDN